MTAGTIWKPKLKVNLRLARVSILRLNWKLENSLQIQLLEVIRICSLIFFSAGSNQTRDIFVFMIWFWNNQCHVYANTAWLTWSSLQLEINKVTNEICISCF